jgi:hypothetical protein
MRGNPAASQRVIPNVNSARVLFSYNVVDLFRAMRGGCVLGIIAYGR